MIRMSHLLSSCKYSFAVHCGDTWSPNALLWLRYPLSGAQPAEGQHSARGNWHRAILYLKWRFDCNLYRDEWQFNDSVVKLEETRGHAADRQLPHQVSPDPSPIFRLSDKIAFSTRRENKTFNEQPFSLLIVHIEIQPQKYKVQYMVLVNQDKSTLIWPKIFHNRCVTFARTITWILNFA